MYVYYTCICVYIHTHMYIYVNVCMYIYIYIYREREREMLYMSADSDRSDDCMIQWCPWRDFAVGRSTDYVRRGNCLRLIHPA